MISANSEPPKTKAAPPATDSAASKTLQTKCAKSRKWRTTLSQLLQGPRHRFQAENWGDHALHTTVSNLRRAHGLEVDKDWTDVPNRFGSRTRVRRYWLDDQNRELAESILAGDRETPHGERQESK